MTFVLDRLGKAGLVERVRDERDKRKVLFRFSESGHQLIEHLITPILSRSHSVMDRFSATELATVARFMEAAAAAMSSHRESIQRAANSASPQ